MRKKIIIIVSFSFILLILLLFLLKATDKAKYNYSSYNRSGKICSKLVLVAKDDCFQNLIVKYVDKVGLKEVIAYQEMGNVSSNDFGECHTLAHYLGKIGYESFLKGKIVDYKSCGDGYLHGFLEASINHGGVGSLYKAMSVICGSSREELANCLHGMGHSLYLAQKSLAFVANYCGSINLSKVNREERIFYCFQGYAMERDFNQTLLGAYNPKTFRYDNIKDLYNFCNFKSEEMVRGLCLITLNRYILDDQFFMAAYYKENSLDKYNRILTDAFSYTPKITEICQKPEVKFVSNNFYSCYSELGADVASLAYAVFNFDPNLTINLYKQVCRLDKSWSCGTAFINGIYGHIGKSGEDLVMKVCESYPSKEALFCKSINSSIKRSFNN